MIIARLNIVLVVAASGPKADIVSRGRDLGKSQIPHGTCPGSTPDPACRQITSHPGICLK